MAHSDYNNAEEGPDAEWYAMLMEAEYDRRRDLEVEEFLDAMLAPEPTVCRNPWWGQCLDACLDDPDNIPF